MAIEKQLLKTWRAPAGEPSGSYERGASHVAGSGARPEPQIWCAQPLPTSH